MLDNKLNESRIDAISARSIRLKIRYMSTEKAKAL